MCSLVRAEFVTESERLLVSKPYRTRLSVGRSVRQRMMMLSGVGTCRYGPRRSSAAGAKPTHCDNVSRTQQTQEQLVERFILNQSKFSAGAKPPYDGLLYVPKLLPKKDPCQDKFIPGITFWPFSICERPICALTAGTTKGTVHPRLRRSLSRAIKTIAQFYARKDVQ